MKNNVVGPYARLKEKESRLGDTLHLAKRAVSTLKVEVGVMGIMGHNLFTTLSKSTLLLNPQR